MTPSSLTEEDDLCFYKRCFSLTVCNSGTHAGDVRSCIEFYRVFQPDIVREILKRGLLCVSKPHFLMAS